MVTPLLNRLRDFQRFVREEGLGSALLALPAPKLLLLPSAKADEVREEIVFAQVVTEPEILSVSKDLFQSGFYNQAVEEAFKALDKYVQAKSGISDQSGTTLMNNAFSEKKPVLVWSERKTESELNEQKGYQLMFSGGFLGIRNPVTHEINWISDHSDALDAILVAQHLLRKAKASKKVQISE